MLIGGILLSFMGATALRLNSMTDLMNSLKTRGHQPFLKVISGLANYNIDHVLQIVSSAEIGGADFVDVAAHPEVVSAVKARHSIPVCVSSIYPEALAECVTNFKADLVEIGNFDALYDLGRDFSGKEVLEMATKTRKLLPNTIMSVTIPHKLSLESQAALAIQLKAIDTNFIQTEGSSAKQRQKQRQEQGQEQERDNRFVDIRARSIEAASETIRATEYLSSRVDIPIMCSSGLNDITAPLAINAGASGIGVGSMISKRTSREEMVTAVISLVNALKKGRCQEEAVELSEQAEQMIEETERKRLRQKYLF